MNEDQSSRSSIASDSDTSETSEDIAMREIEIIDKMFPNAKFTVAIPLSEIDDVVSENDHIILKKDMSCYCYDGLQNHPKAEWFLVKRPEGQKLTNAVIIRELIKQNLELDCNHCFLESFDRYPKDSECQFEIGTGS